MGFVRKRGRFVLLRDRKGNIMDEFFYILFQLILVILVVAALIQYVNNVATDLGFEKRFASIDMALLATAVHYAPGTLKHVYVPLKIDAAVDASYAKSLVQVNERDSKLAPKVYWFLSGMDRDVFRATVSLKAVEKEIEAGFFNISLLEPPNITFYSTGKRVSLTEKDMNALQFVCPVLNTSETNWKSRKVFIAKVLQTDAERKNASLPTNRVAQILTARYSNFAKSDAPSVGGSAISGIPQDAEIVIALGDSGEGRENGSLVVYIPVDDLILRERKLACFMLNELLTADTTVYYAQVMPAYPGALNKTTPLRVFKEKTSSKQVMVFLDISTFDPAQVNVDNIAVAIYKAIERYYGGYDIPPVSGSTFSFSGTVVSGTTAATAGQASAAATPASAAAQSQSAETTGGTLKPELKQAGAKI